MPHGKDSSNLPTSALCPRCNRILPAQEFYKSKRGHERMYLSTYCKRCHHEVDKLKRIQDYRDGLEKLFDSKIESDPKHKEVWIEAKRLLGEAPMVVRVRGYKTRG